MIHLDQEWIEQFPLQLFPEKAILIEPHSVPRKLLAIKQGIVKMASPTDEQGQQSTLTLFTRGNIIPLPATLLKRTNNYIFESLTEVEAHIIPAAKFHSHLRQNQKLMEEVLNNFLKSFDVMMEQAVALKSNKAEDKVKVALKQLVGRAYTTDKHPLIQYLSQSDIAELAGVSRETVSRMIPKLIKDL